jgi:hypothetical protein
MAVPRLVWIQNPLENAREANPKQNKAKPDITKHNQKEKKISLNN